MVANFLNVSVRRSLWFLSLQTMAEGLSRAESVLKTFVSLLFLKVFPLSFQLRCVVLCLIVFVRTGFLLTSSYLSPENTCKLWKKCPPVQVCPGKFNKFTSLMLMLMLQWKDLKVSTVLFSQEMPPFYLQVESQMTFSVYFNVVCVKFCFTDNSLLTLWLNTCNTFQLQEKV